MKVLLVSPVHVDDDGKATDGLSLFTIRLAKYLKEKNHEVVIWSPLNYRKPQVTEIGEVPFYSCSTRSLVENLTIKQPNSLQVIMKSFKRLYKAKTLRPSSYVSTILQVKRFLKIVNEFKPEVVHVHGASLYTLPIIFSEIKPKKIITLHGLIGLDKNIKAPFNKSYVEETVYNCDAILTVVSKGIANNVNKLSGKLPLVIENGIQSKFFETKLKNDIKRETFRILTVGSIQPRKNQKSVIQAISKIKDRDKIEYWIVGKDLSIDYKNELLKEVERLDLIGKVKFLGIKTGQDLLNTYLEADAFILPSTSEGFGLVLIEAMASGVPSIIPKELDASYIIKPYINGLLADDNNPEALSNTIEEMMNVSWDKEEIRQSALSFNEENCFEKYEELYIKIR